MNIVCPQCGKTCDKPAGHIARATKICAPIFCGRRCAGLHRRKPTVPVAIRKALKSEYDAKRRIEKRNTILAKKREYHKRTYDPKKAAAVRKERMPFHIEYCRRPEYRAYKSDYDLRRRAQRDFGPFWEAALMLRELESAVTERATRYEIGQTNGTINKAQNRRREHERLVSNHA